MSAASPHFTLEVWDAHAHLFRLTLDIAHAQEAQELSLPVWIPGSYLVREFSQHLSHMRCETHTLTQIRKNAWRVQCAAGERVRIQYLVYAFDLSVRMAYLDAERGFINGTSLFVRVLGQEHHPHRLTILPHQNWQHASALQQETPNTLLARDYDELVDCPIEMGDFDSAQFWRGEFKAYGIRHRLLVTHPGFGWDSTRLLADCQRICEAAIALWQPDYVAHLEAGGRVEDIAPELRPPHDDYLFLLNCVADGYGGLEHKNSTALIAPRRDLPRLGASAQSEGYTSLLGLISHEYFHTWCVKRLRPAELAKYDYEQENYTRWLWFFEGFTSYYDDLLLWRAGLVSEAHYFKLLGKNLNHSLQMPGAQVQSVAEASFDAWVKYYRIGENTPNSTVSYYTKGSMVALCFDMQLRQEGSSLDALMRDVWQRCWVGKEGREKGVMTEDDFHASLFALTQRNWHKEFAHWVDSTEDLPLEALLQANGFTIERKEATLNQTLGIRVNETGHSVQIKNVLRNSTAERAGLAAGDEIWGLCLSAAKSKDTHKQQEPPSSAPLGNTSPQEVEQSWRIHTLSDLEPYLSNQGEVNLLIARDGRILRLVLTAPSNKAMVWNIQKSAPLTTPPPA